VWLQRQRFRADDLAAREVGDRHLRGGNEKVRLRAADRGEQIRLELRQLPGADERLGPHQVRYVNLGVPVLAAMQVEHELRERAMQPRDLSTHHHEARSGDARCHFEIEPAEPLADLDVIAWRELEAARLAPARNLAVGALIAPVGHRLIEQVG